MFTTSYEKTKHLEDASNRLQQLYFVVMAQVELEKSPHLLTNPFLKQFSIETLKGGFLVARFQTVNQRSP